MITPQTEIRLLKLPFELDNKNQLTFNNITEQTNYFINRPYIYEDNATYQRKDNVIRYPTHIDDIINYNYVMYKNKAYTNKWFYAFITNMEYKNDNLTEITIKTDVFQTWQFDLVYRQMFVEREHVSNDTIGLHTIDENLNVGEVIEEQENEDASLSENWYIGVYCDYDPETKKQSDTISCQNGLVNGHRLYIFDTKATPSSQIINLGRFLIDVTVSSNADNIKNIFFFPRTLINIAEMKQHTVIVGDYAYEYYTIPFSYEPKTWNWNIPKRRSFSGYTPKNNKCYCYPYNYLLVTNNIGNNNIYKYENFSNNNYATFKIALAMTLGCSGKLIPLNYKGQIEADDESIPLAKYPLCRLVK